MGKYKTKGAKETVTLPALETDTADSGRPLAFALTCGSCFLGIATAWLSRTPEWACVSVIAMVGLAIFPVLHFARSTRSRLISFTVLIVFMGVFAYFIWPETAHRETPLTKLATQPEGTPLPLHTNNASDREGVLPVTPEEDAANQKYVQFLLAEYRKENLGKVNEASAVAYINTRLQRKGIPFTVTHLRFDRGNEASFRIRGATPVESDRGVAIKAPLRGPTVIEDLHVSGFETAVQGGDTGSLTIKKAEIKR